MLSGNQTAPAQQDNTHDAPDREQKEDQSPILRENEFAQAPPTFAQCESFFSDHWTVSMWLAIPYPGCQG